MQNNLNFISPGKLFPPINEIERLQNYKDNLLLFKDSTYLVSKSLFKDASRRVTRVLNDYLDMIGYPVELNYHKLTSVSISDLVCGEKPTVKINNNEEIEKQLDDVGFYQKLRQIVIDLSRFGDAVVRVYSKQNQDNSGEGEPAFAVIQPSSLFKVVDVEDKDNVICVVLATPVETEDSTEDKPKWELQVQEHYKGYYVKKVFDLDPIKNDRTFKLPSGRTNVELQRFEIKKQKGADERIETGLKDFAVITLHQLPTSDDCYGHDDYASLDPILAEIWSRIGEMAIILDKHSRPDLYIPQQSLSEDSVNGRWEVPIGGGNTFVLGPGDPTPGYLTWDGQLIACFNELEMLFDQLYKISEMGPIYEAAGKGAGQIAWETMKATFVKPLAKARRVTTDIDKPIKQLISLILQLGGTDIDIDDISIDWFDGLPNDEKQEIEKATMKINADLSTPEQENIERFGLTEKQAQDISQKVGERNATKQTQMFGGFSNATNYGDE